MSGSISNTQSKSDTKSSSNSKTDPWGRTIPALTTAIGQIEGLQGSTGATADQQAAIEAMKANAANGNPWATDIGNTASAAFGTQSLSPQVQAAYDEAKKNLSPYASGQYLDFQSNPYMQQMLKTVGDDAANRVNAQFAAAGRDMSGANSGAVARAITNAEAPILMDQYNKQQQNQLGAISSQYGMGTGAASTAQGLNAQAIGTQAQGASLADQALAAQNYGSQQQIQLDQLLKNIPVQNQQAILAMLGPLAGLGGTQDTKGQSTTKGSSTTMSAGASIM
jgi:hypothetical protein